MSESRGFQAGDERLGRVLRDAVEGRGRPVKASVAGAGIGPRAFVSATERRPAGERPRFAWLGYSSLADLCGQLLLGLGMVLASAEKAKVGGGGVLPSRAG